MIHKIKNQLKQVALKSIHLDFLLSFIKTRIPEPNRTGGNSNPQYAIEVLNRNLYLLNKHFRINSIGNFDVAELGPGDSTLIGYLCLHLGCKSWIGYDAYPYSTVNNVNQYHDAIKLLRSQFTLKNLISFHHEFPSILCEQLLDIYPEVQELHPKYVAPYKLCDIPKSAYDFIYAQACFEHIDDLLPLYNRVYNSLHFGGVFINHIDFKSHGRSLLPTGHYRYSKRQMNLINSSHTFRWINSLRPSDHERYIQEAGFEIIAKYNVQISKSNVDYDDDRAIGSVIYVLQRPASKIAS